MDRRPAAGIERQEPADRHHEWFGPRTDCGRDAQRDFRMQRVPAPWEFPLLLLPEYLCQSCMGAPASEGPQRIAKTTACQGRLAMDGTGLREQFRRATHEHFLLSAHGRKFWLKFHARSRSGTGAGVRIQTTNSPSQRKNRSH